MQIEYLSSLKFLKLPLCVANMIPDPLWASLVLFVWLISYRFLVT